MQQLNTIVSVRSIRGPTGKKPMALNLQELKPAFYLILHQLRLKLNYSDSAVFFYQDEEYTPLEYPNEPKQQEIIKLYLLLLQNEEIQQRLAVQTPILLDDINENSSIVEFMGEFIQEELENIFLNTRSWAALPFIFDSQLKGVICLSHSDPGRFNLKNLNFSLIIIQQAIKAHSRLYERVQTMAIQEERQRMARELHDSVTQVFYGIQLEANTALALLLGEQGQGSASTQQLARILELAEAGLAEMRALLFELRPESLEKEGLVAGLQKQLGILQVRHKLKIEASLGEEPKLAGPTKEALYRIAQEALTNVVKHARASRIELSLHQQSDYVIMQVRDDGRGFNPETAVPGHYGLNTMRERVMLVNGTLDISSQPGQGTEIQVFIPTD